MIATTRAEMARLLLAVALSPLSLRVECSPTSKEDRRCGANSTDLRQSTERRLLRQRSRRRQGRGHGGRGETGQGIWRLGDICHTHPLRRALGKYSLPSGFSSGGLHGIGRGATRHTNGIPVLGLTVGDSEVLPAYPPVELWFMLAESTIPGPYGE